MNFSAPSIPGGRLVGAPSDPAGTSVAAGRLRQAFDEADAVIVGAGAGLSTAAGLSYSGPRFDQYFADFCGRFGITDMYSGGFFPFPDRETFWAWWSRHILINRYDVEVGRPYRDLHALLEGRDYFILTTNVDHQFQRAGFDKKRLFYTQGDYGLFQCSGPCVQETYDNEAAIRAMVAEQRNMRVPSELTPRCPRCGRPLTTNLRVDNRFVEDEGWHKAAARYDEFCRRHSGLRMLYLELGVGMNTPVIIKYPFWSAVANSPQATFACINYGEACVSESIADRSILINANIAEVLSSLQE